MTAEDSPFAPLESETLSSEQAKIASNHGIYHALLERGLLTGDMPSTDGYGNCWGILTDIPVDHGTFGDTDAPLSPIVEALHKGVADGMLAKAPVDAQKAFNFRLSPPLQQDVLRQAMNITAVVQDAATTEPIAYCLNVADGEHYPVWVGADFITFPGDSNAA